jgi:pyrroline-5-carboxylate reductase
MARTHRLGVIGAGNMGAALVRGIIAGGAIDPRQVIVADADPDRASTLASELGVADASGNSEAAAAEYVVLAVKPGIIGSVLAEIAPAMRADQTLVSIAAGVTLARIAEGLGASKPALVRVMPNTPALVRAGALAVAAPGVEEKRLTPLLEMLGAVGLVFRVDEKLMDAVTGLSGSGPAFVFVLIEALADGGVAAGLPRAIAHPLAVQTVLGSAKLVQETGQHPAALKDAVATPAGTTVAGLTELERGGFRGLVAGAVRAAAARARELSSS